MNCWHRSWWQEMSKQEKTLVPKLRFPEFQNTEVWKEMPLKSISPAIFDGTHQTPTYVEKGVPFYSVENLISGNKNKFISEADHNQATKINKPEKEDILITRIGNIGFSAVVTWDFDFSIYVTLAVVKKSKSFNSQYLHGFIQSPRYQSEILKKSLLNAVPCKINMDELRKTLVLLPDLEEQQKIADCLSSIDDLITSQNQKVEALKQHKKGLMQQLFPAEGETVPKLRFPEFRNDWQRVPLGKCFANIGGTALEKYVTDGARHHFISIGNYSPEGKYIDKGQRVEVNDVTKTKLLNKNDLVMVLNDKTLAGDIIGSTLLIDEDDKYIYNQRSERLIVGENFTSIFAWHLLNSDNVRKEIFKRSQGGTQIYVNFPAVKAITLCIPKEPKEQQKIADLLSSLDDLITIQTQQLEAYKNNKKGLMQQLFPSLEEVA